MKFITLFLFLVCSPAIGAASSAANDTKTAHVQLSINEFLSTALNDPVLSLQDERIRCLKEGPGGMSFMEDPIVSVTIDKFENNQQEYAIRFKPKGWGEIKGQKALQNAMVQSGQIQRESLLHLGLKKRYTTVIEALFSSELLSLYGKWDLLLVDWQHVLKRYADTLDFDAGDLSEIENQRVALQMDTMEQESLQDGVSAQVALQSGRLDGATLSFVKGGVEDLISIDMLWERVNAFEFHTDKENIYLSLADGEVAKSEAEYELDVAGNRRILSFIETKYDTSDDEFEDGFSVEIGISIPIGSSKQDTIWQHKLARMKSKNTQQLLKREISQKIPTLKNKLHTLIDQYKLVQNKKTNNFGTAVFNQLMDTEGTDPLTLLKLKKGSLKTEILLAKLSRTIFVTYIELLDISGKLSEKPLLNYLCPLNDERLL